MKNKKYVLIDGVHRSGTTLLHRLFDGAKKCLVSPSEDGIVRGVGNFYQEFVSAFEARNFRDLRIALGHTKYWDIERFADAQQIIYTGVNKEERYKEYQIDIDFYKFDSYFRDKMNSLGEWNLENLVDTFFDSLSRNLNELPDIDEATHIIMKTPRSTAAIPLFLKCFDKAYVIYIIRDPRACYTSSRKGNNQLEKKIDTVPIDFIDSWQADIKRILSYEAKYNDKIKIIRYEDLIMDTETVIKEICNHVDLEFHDILLQPTTLGRNWYGDSHFVHQRGLDKDALVRWKEYWEKECRETFCFYLDRKISDRFNYKSEEYSLRDIFFRINNGMVIMWINKIIYKIDKVIRIISSGSMTFMKRFREIVL